jgi:hypothetical protein
MKWFTRAFNAVADWVRSLRSEAPPRRYRLEVFEERSRAVARAQQAGVITVYRSAGADKWCFFKCPCGCEQQVVLNLMKSHHPAWRIVQEEGGPSVYPSVDSTTCGAHFLVHCGSIVWC